MGNTGSQLKKLRKSLRRISLSKSRERLDRGDQIRRSTSLMNLSALRSTFMQKKKSRSTVLIPQSCQDEVVNPEVTKSELSKNQNVSAITKLNCSISNTAEIDHNDQELSEGQDESGTAGIDHNKQELSQGQDESGTAGEEKIDFEKKDAKTNTEKKIEVDTQIKHSRTKDDEMISKTHSIDVSSNDSVFPEFVENLGYVETHETNPVPPVNYERHDCCGVIALKKIYESLHDIEQRIEQMPHVDLLIQLSTFKDEIHTLWIKSYEIEDSSDEVYPKKCNTIEYTKRVLHKLYSKAFKQHNYRITETNI